MEDNSTSEMTVVVVSNIPLGKCGGETYHESGEIIFKTGDVVEETTISLLKRFKIYEVLKPLSEESMQAFVFRKKYKALSVERLPDGFRLSKPMRDDKGRILFNVGEVITAEAKQKLKTEGVGNINVPRSIEERRALPAIKFRAAYEALRQLEALKIPEETMIRTPSREVSEKGVDERVLYKNMDVKPEGESLADAVDLDPRTEEREEAEKTAMVSVKDSSENDLYQFFSMFKGGNEPDGGKVVTLSKKLIESLINDKDLLLNSINLKSNLQYLVRHSVDVAVLSINTATSLGYNASQVLEIAYAAFLHDIGMFKIPTEILGRTGPLDVSERLEVQKHAFYSFEYLQRLKRLPYSTPVVVFQVHEREDKSGYPRQRPGRLIHKFAKIISVADVYSALISDRPYRKAFSPYQAMRKIIEMGAEGKLHKDVIRSFLKFVCLFPVGSWVKLNTGEKGKIIAPNADDYTKPVVRVMFDENGGPVNRVVDLLKEPDAGIVDGLNWDVKNLTADMKGF